MHRPRGPLLMPAGGPETTLEGEDTEEGEGDTNSDAERGFVTRSGRKVQAKGTPTPRSTPEGRPGPSKNGRPKREREGAAYIVAFDVL